MSSVFSRSQSSKISTGAWPPSSIVTRVMLSAHSRIRCLPTSVEPVKLTLRMTRLAMSVSADRGRASPWTSWATPAGMPASASARNSSVAQPGRLVRRPRDHGAAGGERGADLLGQQIDREVPRREGRDRADRLADHAAELAGGADEGAAIVALGVLGIPVEQLRRRRALRAWPRPAACPAPASSSRPIWSARSRSSAAALWRIAPRFSTSSRAPFGPGPLRGGERLLEVGLGGVRHFGDRPGVDRVDDRVAGIRRFPDAVDEELEVGFVSHWRADRHRLMHPQRPATATDKGESKR